MKARAAYGWQTFYEEAILATNRTHLPRLIAAAQAAIEERTGQLQCDGGGSHEEQLALSDAQAGLRILTKEITS